MSGKHGRIGGVTAVEGRLAAAGLRIRHLDTAPGVAQQLERCEADTGAHRVDETGDEQPDAGRRWRV